MINNTLKKLQNIFFILLLFGCSTEDKRNELNKLSPSNFLIGTWVSPNNPIRITFSSDNIIEENIIRVNDLITRNFKEEYSSNEFSLKEEVINDPNLPESYTIEISRKDGMPLGTVSGQTKLYRRFYKVIFQGKESIELAFPGYSGSYLFRE